MLLKFRKEKKEIKYLFAHGYYLHRLQQYLNIIWDELPRILKQNT